MRGRGRAVVREAVGDGRERVGEAMRDLLARIEERADGADEVVADCRELVALADRREELVEAEVARRLDHFVRVQEAVGRLRDKGSVEAIIRGAPAAVAEACDFDRVVVFRVAGSEMVAEAFYHRDDPARAARLLAYSREHPAQLHEQILETEMIRRRRPIVVHDAQSHPATYKPLVRPYGTWSYVAAPIMPEGRVIGFVHADKGVQRPQDPYAVDEFDRDVLWGFAEGLGSVIERLELVERLRAQSAQVRRLVAQAVAAVDEYVDLQVDLVGGIHDGTGAASTARAILAEPVEAASPLSPLTRREREVLSLVAGGATNAQIADRLVISVGTAKSHVARILRKLGAANRVEASATYLRATGR